MRMAVGEVEAGALETVVVTVLAESDQATRLQPLATAVRPQRPDTTARPRRLQAIRWPPLIMDTTVIMDTMA